MNFQVYFDYFKSDFHILLNQNPQTNIDHFCNIPKEMFPFQPNFAIKRVRNKAKSRALVMCSFFRFHNIFLEFLLKFTKFQEFFRFSRGTALFQGFSGRVGTLPR